MRRATVILTLLVGSACGGSDEELRTALSIDAELSLASSLGGDVGLAVDIDDCSRIAGPATASAEGRTLATVDAPEPLTFAGGSRFIINVPASALTAQAFGLPVAVEITVEAVCDGERVKSTPYPLTYIPTLRGFPTAPGVSRFWPSDVEGELLSCEGTSLQRHDSAGSLLSEINLGFSCTLGELRGGIGQRRYLTVDAGGMAAIDPGPVLVWTRHSIAGSSNPEDRFVFDAAWTSATEDIVVQYKQVAGGNNFVALVDRDTGLNLSPTMPLAHIPLGAVTRNPDGNIAVLTAEKESIENVYYIELFTPSGVEVRPPVQASRYPVGTPYAEFSFEGDRLYVSADDGEQNRWIQSVAVTDGAITQLTLPADGFRFVVGEAYFRLLAASENGFVWLNRDTGAAESAVFAPESGNDFYRLRVEPDGSVIMLADETGPSSASGFYVFAPDGGDVIRLLSSDQAYGWLAESWTGGSLISVLDASAADVQVIPTRAEYTDLAN